MVCGCVSTDEFVGSLFLSSLGGTALDLHGVPRMYLVNY